MNEKVSVHLQSNETGKGQGGTQAQPGYFESGVRARHFIILSQGALKMNKNCRQEAGRNKREREKCPLKDHFR